MLKTDKKVQQNAVSKVVAKQMRNAILQSSKYPEQQINVIWPRKCKVMSYRVKISDDKKIEFITIDDKHNFIVQDKIAVPNLKIIHMYPNIFPIFRVDDGAVKFILNGANVMCKGLTNQNASMEEVESGTIVSIFVTNHQHAVGVGIAQMSSKQIRDKNEGIAVQILHYLGDPFWNILYTNK